MYHQDPAIHDLLILFRRIPIQKDVIALWQQAFIITTAPECGNNAQEVPLFFFDLGRTVKLLIV